MEFDFLGKDSIRYNNVVPVEKRVYRNLQIFVDNKKRQDDLFDRLDVRRFPISQFSRRIRRVEFLFLDDYFEPTFARNHARIDGQSLSNL